MFALAYTRQLHRLFIDGKFCTDNPSPLSDQAIANPCTERSEDYRDQCDVKFQLYFANVVAVFYLFKQINERC